MLQFLNKKYDIKTGDNSEKMELEKLREEIKVYRQKYNKEDKEMEVSSESDSNVSPEEQKKIDEEMKKRQQKKKVLELVLVQKYMEFITKKSHLYLESFQKLMSKKNV